MKFYYLLPYLILFLFISGCKENDGNKNQQPPEGCINLSELETNQDYLLPFALENDIDNIRLAILNNDTIDFQFGDFIDFSENGFYELILLYKDTNKENDVYLFTTTTEEREDSEWGIRAWMPAPFKTISLGSEEVEVFYPHRFAESINVPFIFYIRESGKTKAVYCEGKCSGSGDSFSIKQGEGSINLAASAVTNTTDFIIGGKKVSATITKISEPYIELRGTISSPIVIPANSLVYISGNLDIVSSGSLTVLEGALILIDEAVDINVSGPILFKGTAGNPVCITCSQADKFWGGFITRVSGGSIEAEYTIFCQSGYHDSEGYNWGHSGRQALFYTENSTLKLDHCFMLDHIGQIFYPQSATLILDDILIQRAQTGGQVNYSDLILQNSILTDFPDDSYIFQDNDNDALYLSASDAEIENTIFMFAKDDGLDSGNSEGGEITLTNCRFEACFHEGAALSSGGTVVKNHTFTGCIFTNCGQGLELGFSSPNHAVLAENCMFLDNGVGIRFGDNYDWSDVNGKMIIKNSNSLFNDKDVWNMVRMDWSPKLERILFENTFVSQFCPQYPELKIRKE
jgi:hypothetical protein